MITSSSPWMSVHSYNSTISMQSHQLSTGMVRYNNSQGCFQVYDGSAWVNFYENHTIDLSMTAQEVLQWAQKRMLEERELDKLMEQHPGLRDLHEKFEIMLKLVKQEKPSGL